MHIHRILPGLALAVLLVTATAASANPIAIYNTGVNAAGTGLAANKSVDPHWTIASSPASSAPANAYAIQNSTATSAGWATNAASQWIAPAKTHKGAPGAYSYQTSFDLSGLDDSTASLSGRVAVDNCLTDVLINGFSTGIKTTGNCGKSSHYKNFLAFTISTGFVSGVNTLTFLVSNTGSAGNKTGIDILISGTAKALSVPEPAHLGLLGLTLLGLGGLWSRRRG